MGDSHIQTSINPRIVTNSVNVASGGEAYFYSFLKIRAILEANPHVEMVVVGMSSAELTEAFDGRYDDADRIERFVPHYFDLMEAGDVWNIFIANPAAVALAIPSAARRGLWDLIERRQDYVPLRQISTLGRFAGLETSRLNRAKARFDEGTRGRSAPVDVALSIYQTKYLSKIYGLTQTLEIDLVLLNVPVHPLWSASREDARQRAETFARDRWPDARIVDDSRFRLPEDCFLDLSHLNARGARIYSEFFAARVAEAQAQPSDRRSLRPSRVAPRSSRTPTAGLDPSDHG